MRQAKEDGSHPVLVQPEETAVRPAMNVSDGAGNSPYCIVKVDLLWVERIVKLYIIDTDDFCREVQRDREQLSP